MAKIDMLTTGTMNDFLNYNKEFDTDKFRGSEATKFDMKAIETWLSVRDKLSYIEDYEPGEWRTLEISRYRSKYGTNYIFIDIANKKWRIRETAGEFYGYRPKTFDNSELQ